MRSLFDSATRQEVTSRVARLRSDTRPLWGRFTGPQMLAHINDALRMAMGDLPTKPKRGALRYPPLKQIVVYWLPWPKGAPTAPELLARIDQAQWSTEVAVFPQQLERFGARARERVWPEHPAFGRLSPRAWGVLQYRHLDHHLRQFGV